jgi:hypothetical protein
MPNANGSVWTEALVADLVRLWSHGYSCAQIGAVIGVTRNAVIGKARRLNLPAHTRARNVNGQKRAFDPIPSETPHARQRPPKTIFKSRERKPRARVINPDAKPPLMTVFSVLTGNPITVARQKYPRLDRQMTKDELRNMLTEAVRNTAATVTP